MDLLDPDDGYYQYSAVMTSKTVSGRHNMAARGLHEKAKGVLKSGFAFDFIPSQRLAAQSAWQWFGILTFNLTRGLQRATTATTRAAHRKRRSMSRFNSIRALRCRGRYRAGLWVRP
jgi:hypothetical protein